MKGKRRSAKEGFAVGIENHRQVAKSSCKRLLASPVSSLMTSFVIAIALLLPALLNGLGNNLSAVLDEFQSSSQILLYLHDTVSEEEGLQVSEDLLTYNAIEQTRYISKNEALRDFAASSGFGELLRSLTINPLPASIIVIPESALPASVESLSFQLQEMTEVELVQLDSIWLTRLNSLVILIDEIAIALVLIVTLAVVFVVGNTIKLAIEGRRDEIRVIKLVGGTNSFAARPFLYTGLLYGLAGGLIACLLQALVLSGFNNALAELVSLYDSNFELRGLGWVNAILMILAGAILGWLGAVLSSIQHLLGINP
ncbi:MAG: permease-like cell division protein FtsX [Gammaproteobacteria bacterium]|jgi:cell division transport system permease protein|nr:cell division protein FtsX [Gammaproteobacteria bacterium]MDP6097398.1 permease-like cell division protein FtsX [Gammaproteobacteria bacterium]|tara:strand:+ start:9375 stop:10313 length:939 start_codon:yes stop_codon:yes gene_type:complete